MLPRTLLELSTRTTGDEIVPHYLTERDHAWLRALLDEYARFEGQRRSDLAARLTEPLPVAAPRARLRVAAQVLDSLAKDRATSAVPPPEARWRVFRAAAGMDAGRDVVLGHVAGEVGVSPSELDLSLFADLRGERRVPALPAEMCPATLALKANLTLVSSLLRRAASVRIVAFGNARALVRHARLLGLICRVEAVQVTDIPRLVARAHPRENGSPARPQLPPVGAMLEVSGPLALFHHTEVYGRALASLVPRAAWCHDFELTAKCAVGQGGHLSTFILRTGDPIGVGQELARYDSKVEERFAREFRRAAPDWDLIREPRPVDAGGEHVFPDFELVHRRDPSRRWLLEIVGFWTADYLAEKLRRLRLARLDRLILCIDERRQCRDRTLPEDARVVRYKTSIDPRAVLAVMGDRQVA